MSEPEEAALRQVVVTVCQNCIDQRPGTCHTPGCLFSGWRIEDTPQPLKYLIAYLNQHDR